MVLSTSCIVDPVGVWRTGVGEVLIVDIRTRLVVLEVLVLDLGESDHLGGFTWLYMY